MKNKMTIAVLATLAVAALAAMSTIFAQRHMGGHGRMHGWMHGDRTLLFGAPSDPSETWKLARGGLLYDNWAAATGRDAPGNTHPSYPATAKQAGPETWRCKECHGWDYKGKDGKYASGSHATGIIGIFGSREKSPEGIARLLRDQTHRYLTDMISDGDLAFIAAFVSRGQHDTDRFIDAQTGDVKAGSSTPAEQLERGRGLYQTTCAVCHGFDGRRLNFGDVAKPKFIGTEAQSNPWEVLHKIRNGHPGVEMISLRALPIEDAASLLAYARALPNN